MEMETWNPRLPKLQISGPYKWEVKEEFWGEGWPVHRRSQKQPSRPGHRAEAPTEAEHEGLWFKMHKLSTLR